MHGPSLILVMTYRENQSSQIHPLTTALTLEINAKSEGAHHKGAEQPGFKSMTLGQSLSFWSPLHVLIYKMGLLPCKALVRPKQDYQYTLHITDVQ